MDARIPLFLFIKRKRCKVARCSNCEMNNNPLNYIFSPLFGSKRQNLCYVCCSISMSWVAFGFYFILFVFFFVVVVSLCSWYVLMRAHNQCSWWHSNAKENSPMFCAHINSIEQHPSRHKYKIEKEIEEPKLVHSSDTRVYDLVGCFFHSQFLFSYIELLEVAHWNADFEFVFPTIGLTQPIEINLNRFITFTNYTHSV